jgi:malonyl-CoA O-methyltransferase
LSSSLSPHWPSPCDQASQPSLMPTEPTLDRRRIHRNFARAAAGYDEVAVLNREVCARMVERLDLVRLAPRRILDAGSGTGLAAQAVMRRYPGAHITALDFCLPMLNMQRRAGSWRGFLRAVLGSSALAQVCADLDSLPIRAGAMDLAVSNLALQWTSAPEATFRELHRVLRRGGLLMFTTFGPDTLKELAQASADAGGRSPVHRFIDMHDLGDMLVASGFAAPVVDMEVITLTYPEVPALLRDLKASGETCAARDRLRGLMGRREWERMLASYECERKEGRLPATIEVIYGHAWKGEPRTSVDGRQIIKVELGAKKSR